MSSRKARKPWLRLGLPKTIIDRQGFATTIREVELPKDEKVVVKEVPAKVDGTVVGTAQIYEDGTVGVIIDEDAPEWAKEKIRVTAKEVGYSIGEI